jgi:hypothetical protein
MRPDIIILLEPGIDYYLRLFDAMEPFDVHTWAEFFGVYKNYSCTTSHILNAMTSKVNRLQLLDQLKMF